MLASLNLVVVWLVFEWCSLARVTRVVVLGPILPYVFLSAFLSVRLSRVNDLATTLEQGIACLDTATFRCCWTNWVWMAVLQRWSLLGTWPGRCFVLTLSVHGVSNDECFA